MPILENEIKLDIGPGLIELFKQITHIDNVQVPPNSFLCMVCLQQMEAALRIQEFFIRANEVIVPVPEDVRVPEIIANNAVQPEINEVAIVNYSSSDSFDSSDDQGNDSIASSRTVSSNSSHSSDSNEK